MRVRTALLAATSAAAMLAPLPALAHEDTPQRSRAGELAEKLNDPLTQYAVAGMVSAMSKALLDMPVEPLVKAMEQASGRRVGNLPDQATMGDLAGADRARVRDEIVTQVPRAMAAMGALAGAAEAMTPQIEDMARRVRESTPGL